MSRSASAKISGGTGGRPVPLNSSIKPLCNSRITLSGEKSQTVIWRRSVEDQRLGDALAGHKHTIGQEYAEIRIAAPGDSTGVGQSSLVGKALYNHQDPTELTYSVYRPDLAALGAIDGLMPSGRAVSTNDGLSRRDKGLEFLNVTNDLETQRTGTNGSSGRPRPWRPRPPWRGPARLAFSAWFGF